MQNQNNCSYTNIEHHDGSRHQRQPAGRLAPPDFVTRQSAVKNAQNQVQKENLKQRTNKNNFRNISSYNVQGLLSKTKQILIADDFFIIKFLL